MKLKSLSLALMLLSLQAMAAVQESTQQGTRTSSSSQVSTTTQELQQQAGQWGLSEEDYRRYRTLMEGPRGIQSPGLDPLTVLGIEARTDAERRVLAEKWVTGRRVARHSAVRSGRAVSVFSAPVGAMQAS